MTMNPTSQESVVPPFTSIPFMEAVAMSDQEAEPPGMAALGRPEAVWIRCSSHRQPENETEDNESECNRGQSG